MTGNSILLSPKSFSELISAISKYENETIFAGGTFLMRQEDYYPGNDVQTYISLSDIPELHKVMHLDRYIEVGSMVTIQQLLNSGSHTFSKELVEALENIGTTILRNQITIGGALCTPKSRYALSCILCALNAQVEMRFILKKGLFKKLRVRSVWISADKLYDEKGAYIYPDNAILTRVRIPVIQNTIQHFETIGSPVNDENSSVIMAMQYSVNQESVTSPSFCISFINNGLFISSEFENVLKTLKFPLSTQAIKKTSVEMDRIMRASCPDANELQLERARRIVIATLFNANTEYLQS